MRQGPGKNDVIVSFVTAQKTEFVVIALVKVEKLVKVEDAPPIASHVFGFRLIEPSFV